MNNAPAPPPIIITAIIPTIARFLPEDDFLFGCGPFSISSINLSSNEVPVSPDTL